jgi:hypothetical protein
MDEGRGRAGHTVHLPESDLYRSGVEHVSQHREWHATYPDWQRQNERLKPPCMTLRIHISMSIVTVVVA